jgi:Beta-lactamase enzyme family
VPHEGDDELDELFGRWERSGARSRERRRESSRRRGLRLWPVAAVAMAALVAVLPLQGRKPRAAPIAQFSIAPPFLGTALVVEEEEEAPIPRVRSLARAWRFARARGGEVSIAVVDSAGRLRGRRAGKRYISASVVKAMLLVAELRRLRASGESLDADSAGLLDAMITLSDNDAADAIYERVGDAGLLEVARRARMRRFGAHGYWANSEITAADMARLFARMPRLLPRRFRRAGLRMLAGVVEEQRWGIPEVAEPRWTVFFKGGWRSTGTGELVHQVALLRRRGGHRIAIAVLTDGQPSHDYGVGTVQGAARRLLRAGPQRPGADPHR